MRGTGGGAKSAIYDCLVVVVAFLSGMATKTTVFPGQEDLAGAAEALLRLQDTYALGTHQIATGDLMGVHDSPRMSGIPSKLETH